MEYITSFFENFIDMFVDVSAYLILGLIFVGLLNAYIKRETVLRHLGGDSFVSVVKASCVGVPLPLCSCGVVPTAIGLKKSGASNGAVTSFLISTPQTGVDSIIATYSLMGPVMAFFRPIAAFVSGIFGGFVVNLFAKHEKINTDVKSECGCGCHEEEKVETCGCGCHEETKVETCGCGCHEEAKVETCGCGCHEEAKVETCGCGCHEEEKVETCGCGCHEEVEETACSCGCHSGGEKAEQNKLVVAMKNAFGHFLDEMAVHFLIGMLISALIATFIPADFFVNLGLDSGILAMIAMVIIGIPMYICSVGAIPIAISLVAKGLSYGAGFVFLFAGPVTNIASILVLSKALGKKITAIYVTVMMFCSIGFGLLLDFLIANFNLEVLGALGGVSHGNHILNVACAILFAILMIKSLAKKISLRKFFK